MYLSEERIMSLSRIVSVTVVCLVLLAIAVPAAQARTLDTSPRVLQPVNGSWLAASVSWLAQIFGLERQAPQGVVAKTDTTTTTTTSTSTGLHPMTGSCIDPLGNTKPWCSI
jgi:hypothetical protein